MPQPLFRFKSTHFCILLALIFGFTACKTVQKPIPPFFQDPENKYPAFIDVQVPQVSRIQKEDLLGITVSSLNMESNEILNFSNINSLSVSSVPGGGGGASQPIGYPVDTSGNISMAFIGKVQVAGLTLEAAQGKIRAALEQFLKAFSLLDDRTTIVDALASAGDMSVFAKRDSVTIIRDMNGKRVIDVVNMVNRDVFTSPYFYLRNGDIIYVEPLPEKRLPLLEDERIRRLQIFTTVLTSLVLVINVVMQVAR
jgi:polysaccharide biosynthesis/export protein